MKRPLAYITAPWSEDKCENAKSAARYCRQVYDAGYSPVCPAMFLPLFLTDSIPQEHTDGIDMARAKQPYFAVAATAASEMAIKMICSPASISAARPRSGGLRR